MISSDIILSLGLKLIIPASQFAKRGKCIMTGHISIMHSRPIDRVAISQTVNICERPYASPWRITIPIISSSGIPRSDPCINAHFGARESYFSVRHGGIFARDGNFALMRSPTYFNWSHSLLPSNFNAPGPYKFINLLWSGSNLSISLRLQWITLIPNFLARWAKSLVFCKVGNFLFILRRDFFYQHRCERQYPVKLALQNEISSQDFAPWSITAVGASSNHGKVQTISFAVYKAIFLIDFASKSFSRIPYFNRSVNVQLLCDHGHHLIDVIGSYIPRKDQWASPHFPDIVTKLDFKFFPG